MFGVVFAFAYASAIGRAEPSAARVTPTRTSPVPRDSSVPVDITAVLRVVS